MKKIKLSEVDYKKINFETIKGLYFEYKEVINYLIFGVLSTIVNFASYFLFARVIGIEEVLSSGLSWFCAVLFAYITNKMFVFDSKTNTKAAFVKELFAFFAFRVLSGILCDVGTFALMVKVFNVNDIISKFVTQVMVIILNYVLSKFFVFKKK